MSFKDRILASRRHRVIIQMPGEQGETEDVTIVVRPVTLEAFLTAGDKLPSIYRAMAPAELAQDEGLVNLEFMRLLCCLGVVGIQGPGKEVEDIVLYPSPGVGRLTVEDLEMPSRGGEDFGGYANTSKIVEKIQEISDLSFLAELARRSEESVPAAAEGRGASDRRDSEEVQDGPLDGRDELDAGPL